MDYHEGHLVKTFYMQADDVATLVNVGVVCYLKQLLDTGLFMADPHVRNSSATPHHCCLLCI
jgi:predicted unusual protein kinase regulating ubiquinone biosynthesis (AarF/ABC1/UbiB family)